MNGWQKIVAELRQNNPTQGAGVLLHANTKGDKVIWSIVALLVALSLLAVYSSTGTMAYRQQGGNTLYYLVKQIVFISIGVALIYFVHLVDYRFFSKLALWLYIISLPLLAYTLFFGSNINEANRWIRLPIVNLTFQTSDFARLALYLYLARQLSRSQKIILDFKKGFLPLVLPILFTCLLIAPANLSTALLTGFTGLLLLFLGRASIWHLLLIVFLALLPVGLLVGYALANHSANGSNGQSGIDTPLKGRTSTWVKRIQDFVYATPDSEGHQVMHAKMAISKGGWLGKGPGNSEERNLLPHPYSDFIYTIIIEEYGLLGGTFLLVLYMLFLFRCILIIQRSPKAFGAFLALALSFTLTIQALVNMAVNVGLFPVTGVTLPLISMGGTSMMFNCIAIGIILSVAKFIEKAEANAAVTSPEPINEMPNA